MAADQIRKLAIDPEARVMVFVDGQNLYNARRRTFGHPLCHPHLLAEHLAGVRTRNRVACRFYTGRPNPNIPHERRRARNLDRRLNAMSRVGVTVVKRPLRYHWDWGHQDELPAAGPGVAAQVVTMTPWQRPQEKGIDLAIALDMLEFALTDSMDVAIVVSFDRDLAEIPRALRSLNRVVGRALRLEAAVPVPDGLLSPKRLEGFHFTHQVTPAVFALVRDDTNYTVPEERWAPPSLPSGLADVERERR